MFSDSALFDIIKIERASEQNTFVLSITDKLFDLPAGSFSYYDLWQTYDFELSDYTTMANAYESVSCNFECIQWIAGEYDRILAWNWNVNLPTYVDVRVDTYTGYPPVQGVKIGTLSDLPTNTPLLSFRYTGNAANFTVVDGIFCSSGQIPIPTSVDPEFPSQVPTAVPEPATIISFGIPMLMVGLGKFVRHRK